MKENNRDFNKNANIETAQYTEIKFDNLISSVTSTQNTSSDM